MDDGVATTLTGVANMALALIGNNTIESLDDSNDGVAKTVRLLLTQTLREVQSHASACWEELVKERDLELRNDGVETPAGKFEYNLPLNCLGVRGVYADKECKDMTPWEIVGGFLRTQRPAKGIRYLEYSENPAEWSPELLEAVVELLSDKLLGAIGKDFATSRKLIETFWQVSFKRQSDNRTLRSVRSQAGNDGQYSRYYPNGRHSYQF